MCAVPFPGVSGVTPVFRHAPGDKQVFCNRASGVNLESVGSNFSQRAAQASTILDDLLRFTCSFLRSISYLSVISPSTLSISFLSPTEKWKLDESLRGSKLRPGQGVMRFSVIEYVSSLPIHHRVFLFWASHFWKTLNNAYAVASCVNPGVSAYT